MMKDEFIPLAEIVEELENGSRPEGGVDEKGDVFSVGGEHLDDVGGFDFSSVKLISHDFFNQMKRGKVKPDDIIIVKDGATTGKTSFVNEQFPHFPCAINEHVFRLAVKQKVADPRYVFYYFDGVPFLSVKNITKVLGTLDFSDIKYISPEEHKKISKLANVERDDILYTKVGATFGYAQIVDTDREFSIFVSVALLKPNKSKILPKFFEVVMNSDFVKNQADMLVSGIGVPDLHLREIKTFQIPLPPLNLQEEFAGVVARVESLRGRMSEAGMQVEGLFESLLEESFS